MLSLATSVVPTKHPSASGNVSDAMEKEVPSPHVVVGALVAGSGVDTEGVGSVAGAEGLDVGTTVIDEGDGAAQLQETAISLSAAVNPEPSPSASPVMGRRWHVCDGDKNFNESRGIF